MRCFILALFFMFSPIMAIAAKADNAEQAMRIIQKAEKLFEIGDYENSLNLFSNCYTETLNPECIKQPVMIVNNTFARLPKVNKTTLTTFTPSKKQISGKQILIDQSWNVLKSFVWGIPTPDPQQYIDLYHYLNGKPDPGAQINTKNPESIKEIVETIPFFQMWIKNVNSLALDCFSKNDQEQCLVYLKDLTELKKKLDTYFRNFFSYEIASPTLARTQQLIFMADESKTFGVDENLMREAAKTLGLLNDDVMRYVNQDVRNQFLDVIKSFKDKAGKELNEELKVVHSLQDKFLNNRYTESMF